MDEEPILLRRPRERGQTLIEYLLILFIVIGAARFIFFNPNFGFKATLDKTMLRFGVYLEQNLKTGTRVGGHGTRSLEPYAGTSDWNN